VEIAQWRLHNQHIAQQTCTNPCEVVTWLGAVQAQDFAAAKWAVGLRMQGATDDALEQACDKGELLRTHVLRPTWHFVAPADIRWMLELTAPRVNAFNAYYYRKNNLDEAVFAQSNAVLRQALQGGKQLTRPELVAALQRAGITADDPLRFTLIVMRAELDAVICSGARRGKQFTYALLDERAPQAATLPRDEALSELTRRYFTSHGPATAQDFIWWSGLAGADVKRGLELVATHLQHEIITGQTYWFAASTPPAHQTAPMVYLLPNYDEYSVGYTDRSAIMDPAHADEQNARNNSVMSNIIVLNGQVVGFWKRELKRDTVIITARFFAQPTATDMRAFGSAANRYGAFLGKSVVIASQTL